MGHHPVAVEHQDSQNDSAPSEAASSGPLRFVRLSLGLGEEPRWLPTSFT